MKKNVSLIIVAVVALAVGYLLGANVGAGDKSLTKGDINAVNTYKQLLVAPEYMSFNESMAGNPEIVDQTISTLQIVERRIADYTTLAGMMSAVSVDDPEVAPIVEHFQKAEKKGQRLMAKASETLQAAMQVKAGEKVNTSKALKNAEELFEYLNTQVAIGKQYVEATDKYLKDKDVKEHILAATMRDLIASHCAVNASLTQNDNEIDYWSNISGLVKHEDMAFSIE